MDSKFNTSAFIQELADELISHFDRANKATTPQLVGSAKERAVRKKFESLLPSIVGVGSGCVIDIHGNTSRQCDIVIYEKDFCPIFSINENPETTYYPCESVIAVGEIKSSLGTAELTDAFTKIKSVKSLKRKYNQPSQTEIGGHEFRVYGSKLIASGAQQEAFNQTNNFRDQIFGFILAEKLSLKMDTFLQKYSDFSKDEKNHLAPNLCLTLKDGLFLYFDKNKRVLHSSKEFATGVQNIVSPTGNFQYLLTSLTDIIYHGRTSNVFPFREYIPRSSSFDLNSFYKDF